MGENDLQYHTEDYMIRFKTVIDDDCMTQVIW